MNLSLAFFHGVQGLVALVLAGAIVVIGVPSVFYVWLWHTKSSERKLTFIYVVVMAVLCVLMAFTANDPLSLFHLTVSMLAFILSLPWNVITLFAVSMASTSDISDLETVAVMLLGAGVNAVLLYFGGKRLRSWKE